MRKYLVNRILSILPVLFVVSVVIFGVINLTPGDPAAAILGESATPEDIAALRERMGLNKPVVVQYFIWLGNLAQGDLGTSVVNNRSVAEMVGSHIGPTISLSIYAMLISVALALPLGMLAARKRGTAADQAVSTVALFGISLPSFLLGLFLMLIFAVKLRWFPVSGYKPLGAGLGQHVRYLTMPAFALGFIYSALMMRMTRASMLEVLNADYIKMAKAKGVREFFIIGKHALRNALIAIITVIGQSFIGALSGATVVESLFGVPGLGQLIVNSIGRRDYQVIVAIVLFIALVNVVISLVVDLLYGVVDPRVRIAR